MGPNFHPPKTTVPPAWVGESGQTTVTTTLEQSLVEWWGIFNDPALTSLVERAVQANLDLKLAEARIRQAEGAKGVAIAALWPSINGTGSYTKSRTPVLGGAAGFGSTSGVGGGTNISSSGTGGTGSTGATKATSAKTVGVIRKLYQGSIGAVWTLDIFGGNRRNVEAANADLRAAEWDRRDVLVTLISQVALNYVSLRGFQQQIVIARRNLDAQRHTVKVTRERFIGGFVGALDVSNAEALADTTEATIPTLETSARQAIYTLSVLLGADPGALVMELSPTADIPPAPPRVPVGIPSDLLRRRPDIQRSEAQIHGATARIGVAVAELFPVVTLNGSVGMQGSRWKDFSHWINRTWSIGPSVSVPIFEGGRVVSNIKLQKALNDQAILTYEKTVLTALQDVENALIASTNEQQRRDALVRSVAANRKAVELSNLLYTQGETDFLSVLDAERSLLTSEDALAQSNRTISTNLVTLYKALGGGWE